MNGIKAERQLSIRDAAKLEASYRLPGSRRIFKYVSLVVGKQNRIDYVLNQFDAILADCYGANPLMITAVNNVAGMIRTKGIAFSEYSPGRTCARGFTPTQELVEELADPAIRKIFPKGSFVDSQFYQLGYPFPLSKYLNYEKVSYQRLVNMINKVGEVYAEICFDRDEREVFDMTCATLGLISDFISALASVAPQLPQREQLKWCSVCFRRYPCVKHTSNRLARSTNVTNQHRRDAGVKTQKSLPPELWEAKAQRQARRRAVCVGLHSKASSAKTHEIVIGNYLGIAAEIQELITETLDLEWAEVAPRWQAMMQINFPFVCNKLQAEAVKFPSWEKFANQIICALDDESEKSTYPLWIIYMLEDAEDWFFAEENLKPDGRKSNSIDLILELYPDKTTNLAEISKILTAAGTKISRQNVAKALKKHDQKLKTSRKSG